MTIYKYNVAAVQNFTVNLPRGAKFLSVQVQHGNPVMWFLVDTSESGETRTFTAFPTGTHVPIRWQYLGTFQLHGGNLVFHLFEKV